MNVLKIENLHVAVEGKKILNGVTLTVKTGEIHALMGPNGNGKSTLVATIMGHPKYEVIEGTITLDDRDVLAMSVDERSRAGLFLSMQYPPEITGVANSDFLKAAMNARREKPIPLFSFIKEVEKVAEQLEVKSDLIHRYLNEGFSGGEKKRNEIVQMKLLKPTFAMLDEIDSGLDVDALRVVGNNIIDLHNNHEMGLIVISHYNRFYELIEPTFAHVLINGKIVMQGTGELTKKIDELGYDWVYQECNIQPEEEVFQSNSLGECALSNLGKNYDGSK